MTDHPKESSGETKLDLLIADYMDRVDRGQQVDIDEFLVPHEDLADQFRSYLRDAQAIDQQASQVDPSALQSQDTNPSLAADETLAQQPNRPEYAGGESLPRDFGRYRLKQELGRGAMGTVYLAEDTELKREVALKQPRFSGGDERAMLERFYREAQAAATLNHPNICPVHDIGEQDGTPYLTMAYVQGRTLAEILRGGRSVSERSAAMLVRKIALALSEAHRRGILHRDLKPGNIMINQRNEPIVMDFGLARRFETDTDTRLTHEGMLVGTPTYMSPEQVECDDTRIGPQSDIYSLGVVFYEMLTGQVPFSGSIAKVIAQIVRDEPARPSSLRPGVSPKADEICMQMISKSQADRFGSMDEAAESLTDYLKTATESVAAVVPGKEASISSASKLKQHADHVHKLIADRELLKAAKVLQTMAADSDPVAANYVTWANEQLVTVQQQIEQKRTAANSIVQQAQSLLDRHAYADAAGLLVKIETPFQTAQSRVLMEQSVEKQTQVDHLFTQIERSLRTGQTSGTIKHLQRLMQLKPNDPVVEYLFRKYRWQTRFGGLGGRLADALAPAAAAVSRSDYDEPFLRKYLALSAFIFLAFCGLTVAGVTIYIKQTGKAGKIAINVTDEALSEGDVEITVDGNSLVDEKISDTAKVPDETSSAAILDSTHKVVTFGNFAGRVDQIAVSGSDLYLNCQSEIHRYAWRDGSEIWRMPHGGPIPNFALSHNGQTLAIPKNSQIQFWDLETRTLSSSVNLGVTDGTVCGLAIDADANTVVALWHQNTTKPFAPAKVFIVDRHENSSKEIAELGSDSKGWGCVAYSRDPAAFYVTSMYENAQFVHKVDAATHEVTMGPVEGQSGGDYGLAEINGKSSVAVPSFSGNTRILDTQTWVTTRTLVPYEDHSDWELCCSLDGKFLATWDARGNREGHILIRSTNNFRPLFEINVGLAIIGPKRVRFTDNGSHLVFVTTVSDGSSTSDEVHVWRLPSNLPTSVNANGGQSPPNDTQSHALRFFGAPSHSRVEVPSLIYDGTTPLTMEAWLKPDSMNGAGIAISASTNSNGAGRSGIHLGVMRDRWYLSCMNDQKHEPTLKSDDAIDFDRWTHVAATREGKTICLFVDGKLAAQRSLTLDFSPSKDFVYLGVVPNPEPSATNYYFSYLGAIDEVRISKNVRYRDEFTPGRHLGSDNDTLALYHCDQGTGDKLSDSSGNGHHGTIIDTKWEKLSPVPPMGSPDSVGTPFRRPALPGQEQQSLKLTTHGLKEPKYVSVESRKRPPSQWSETGRFARVQGYDKIQFPILSTTEFAMEVDLELMKPAGKSGMYVSLRGDDPDDLWVRIYFKREDDPQKAMWTLQRFKGNMYTHAPKRTVNADGIKKLTLLVGNDRQLLFSEGETSPLEQRLPSMTFRPRMESGPTSNITFHRWVVRALTPQERQRLRLAPN